MQDGTGMKLVIAGVAGIVGLFLIFALAPFTIVGAGEVAVITRVGAVQRVAHPGINWVTPLIEGVNTFDVRTQKEQTDASAASKDLQTVQTTVAVNFNLNPDMIADTYSRLGSTYKATVIDPAVQEVVKAITATYTAEELITKRAQVTEEIQVALVDAIEHRAQGKNIIISAVSIINFDFSQSFNQAIEAKVTAEQNALAAKNKLEQIKYEAQQTIETAKAQAESIRIQAQAVNAQGGADYVALQAIAKWNGAYPTTMLGGSSIPLIQLK